MEVQEFPDLPYLRYLAWLWIEARRTGKPLIIEKCRRMVVSWLLRALELHTLGLRRCDQVIAGLTYSAAAKHVWRLEHFYEDLRRERRDWKLPPCQTIRAKGSRQIESIMLANGSISSMLNQESSGIQGEGVAIVTMEEFSRYRYPADMYAQAGIVTKGKPGEVGGFVCIVTNASPHPEWQLIKGNEVDAIY